jgi:hypothetical protein
LLAGAVGGQPLRRSQQNRKQHSHKVRRGGGFWARVALAKQRGVYIRRTAYFCARCPGSHPKPGS